MSSKRIVITGANSGMGLSLTRNYLERGDEVIALDICLDKLAEIKALKVSQKNPENLVLGCDQILSYDGQVFSKPKDQSDLREQLMALKSGTHELFSAAVICQNAQPIWRFIGKARLTMRDFSETFLDNYIAENWKLVENCVGGYQIEGKGIRLFHRVEGDYFSVLGMPLLEIMNFLTVRGVIKK